MIPALAVAQQEDTAALPPATGWLDFGVRGTHVSGDPARYERYRDLGDGLFLETFRLSRDRNNWLFDLRGDHVGRRDQRFIGEIRLPGKLQIRGLWDQIPMLMSETTETLFREISSDVLTIDDAIQTAVQVNVNTLPPLFEVTALTFDTESRRHIAEGALQYLATTDLTLQAKVRYTDREGVIPYGGSFGHSSLVETPSPVNHTVADVDGQAEFSRDRLLARAGYTGSWFHNEATTMAFDNPFRVSDIPATPSSGRLSLAPSN
jgi:hypothetical protein